MTFSLFRGARGSDELVARLRQAVAEGKLAGGTRLPSQRRLAYDLKIAVGTATRAYQMAEREGLIVSYVGRGSFVAHPGIGGPGRRRTARTGRIDLSVDEPIEVLNPDLDEVLRRTVSDPASKTLLDYFHEGWGARHREAGAMWLERFGVHAKIDAVTVCAGSQHAILCALAAVCRSGDLVMAEELSFPGFRGAAELLGLRIEPVAVDAHGIVPAAVEEACRTQSPRLLYVTPGVQNPTNAPLNAARRATLVRLAAQYDFVLLEDVVRPEFEITLPAPIYTQAEDRTFFIGGLSKTLGGGLRISFMAVPARWRERVANTVWASLGQVSPLSAEVAACLIESGRADAVLAAKARESDLRRNLAQIRLGNFDIRLHPVSTLAWLLLPPDWSNAAAISAIEGVGIGVTPADAFWNGRTPPPDALRLCLGAARSLTDLDEALSRIAAVLAGKPAPVRL